MRTTTVSSTSRTRRPAIPFKWLLALVVLGSLAVTAALAPSGADAAPLAGSPSVELTPSSGPVGTKTIVTGSAFGTGTSVSVLWNCATNSCTGATTLATVNTGLSGGFTAIVKIPSAATGTYALGALAGDGAFSMANFTVNTAPVNDDYSNATPLFPLPYSNAKSPEDTTSATTASDDPVITNCGAGNGVNSHSVWFSITPNKTATTPTRVILSTSRSTYPTVLAVFSGARSSMQQMACSTGFQGTTSSKVIFMMSIGVTYHIEIMSLGAGAGGSLTVAADVDRVKVGLYNVSASEFTLRSANSASGINTNVQFGAGGSLPVVGDWTGKGFDSIGTFSGASNGTGHFRLSNSNISPAANFVFAFGQSTDIPVAGDWTGKGFDSIGVYRPSTGTFYLRNSNTGGSPDITVAFGPVNSIPVVGDWTGKGFDSIGVYVPATGTFMLRNSNTPGAADITVAFGPVNAQPVVGDWIAQGIDTLGVYANNTFMLRTSNTAGAANLTFAVGSGVKAPIAGHWANTGGI